MISNYLKIAWRNLLRNRGFSVTNILGLTIGITCTILIALWLNDELNYDKFHRNYDNIYKVYANRDFKNQMFTDPNMVLPLAAALQNSTPQYFRQKGQRARGKGRQNAEGRGERARGKGQRARQNAEGRRQ